MQKLISRILNKKLLIISAIFCTLFIVFLSLSNLSGIPKLKIGHEDKLYHFIAYFTLNTIWLAAMFAYSYRTWLYNLCISCVIIAFGIVIEVLQDVLTDYRVFDYYDILANSLAVIISFLSFEMLKKRIFKIINLN